MTHHKRAGGPRMTHRKRWVPHSCAPFAHEWGGWPTHNSPLKPGWPIHAAHLRHEWGTSTAHTAALRATRCASSANGGWPTSDHHSGCPTSRLFEMWVRRMPHHSHCPTILPNNAICQHLHESRGEHWRVAHPQISGWPIHAQSYRAWVGNHRSPHPQAKRLSNTLRPHRPLDETLIVYIIRVRC